MDEYLFVGDAPTTEAGKEINFPSSEVWVALHEYITSDVYPDLPFHPLIHARDAEVLAAAIRAALADGTCERHFEDQALLDAAGAADRVAADEAMAWMTRFAAFLEGCGGCRPG